MKITIPDVLPRFVEYLRKNPAGGSLHVVLGDGNTADSHVQFCIDYAERNGMAPVRRSAGYFWQ